MRHFRVRVPFPMFQDRRWNRQNFPTKHVLVCEDDTSCQSRIAKHFSDTFGFQGLVQFSFVSGGRAAAGVILWTPIDLVVLDHDMPNGNGSDLLGWMKASNYGMPVITFSGLVDNNTTMMALGAQYKFLKEEVIEGKADDLIRQILGM
jgi:DNA-binding NtrC family response regulator